jgi:AcrR family transcriptional regulator
MPRNRPDRSREDKATEIAETARRLFLADGYEATTVAAIAREAGVATNVVHWYFATKDELFVAVLDQMQTEGLAELEHKLGRRKATSTRAGLKAFLTELVHARLAMFDIIATVHERSHRSSVVAEFHTEAHRRYAESLDRVLAGFELAAADRALAIETLVFSLESLVMHRADKRHAKRMMGFLVDRLLPTGDPRE